MAKAKLYLMVALVAAIFGGGATGFNATHDHDPDQDFSGYQTFAWISAHPMKVSAPAGAANPLLEPRY
jgi:hypothetical protein